MKKEYLFLLFIFCFSVLGSAQDIQPFQKGDRISFLGNSITDGGRYHSYIWLYYMTRFPDRRIEVFNAGIGGDVVKMMNDRFKEDVLPQHPNVIVLTFGMNDSDYFIYLQPGADTASKARIKTAKKNYALLEKRLKELADVRKILMTSTPYDENVKFKNPGFTGKNAAILKINTFMEASAGKNNWEFIDLNNPMSTINQREQKADSSFTLQGKDRIHPEEDGHLVMAYLFLKAQGLAGREIAEVKINTLSKEVQSEKYCSISNLSVSPEIVRFHYKASSLPFPIDTISHGIWGATRTQAEALKVIPFINEFNREMLYCSELKGHKYQLNIDGEKIGEWSGEAFARGINLALLTNTPQYQQAMAIMYLNEERWEIERRLRVYAWYQFDILKDRGLLFKDDLASIDTLQSLASSNPFVKGSMQGYLKARHPEVRAAWKSEMKLLTDKIYSINKPLLRKVEIKLIQ